MKEEKIQGAPDNMDRSKMLNSLMNIQVIKQLFIQIILVYVLAK